MDEYRVLTIFGRCQARARVSWTTSSPSRRPCLVTLHNVPDEPVGGRRRGEPSATGMRDEVRPLTWPGPRSPRADHPEPGETRGHLADSEAGMARHDREVLGVYSLGALDDRQSMLVEEHLTECAGCRAELERLVELRPLLDLLPPEAFADSPQWTRWPRGGWARVGLVLAVAAV